MGGWIESPMPDALVSEGVYMHRPEHDGLLDLRIYVEAGPAQRLQRQLDRGQNDVVWIRRWMSASDYYVAKHDPKSKADAVVSGGG